MSRRATLSAQLAQLTSSGPSFDPDAADNLDGLRPTGVQSDDEAEAAKRDHYLHVGPSRLRGQMGGMAPEQGGKYGGSVRGRQKIFDDDDDDEDEDEDEDDDEEGSQGGSDEEDGDHDEEDEEEDEDEDGEEDESDGEEDEDEGGEEDEAEDGEEDDNDEDNQSDENTVTKAAPASSSSRGLDPVAALRDSRQKDILKGQAIRRQRALFDTLLTIRITFQKALTALSKLPSPPSASADSSVAAPAESDEIISARSDVLGSLAELSEGLFELRQGITLPGMQEPAGLGKRKRVDVDVDPVGYWNASAEDSLELSEAMREQMLPILHKWSTKIQAATLSIGGKAAGSSKFLQGTKGQGQMGVVEAIKAGLANRRNPGPQSTLALEEPHYRALLREIIDSRSTNSHLPDTSYRLEKKKKRDAERGASKGRKIRYTVHEKAANFAVPMEIPGGWGESQTDELFSSLLGGVGMRGGRSEGGGGGLEGLGPAEGGGEGLSGLGGLRVF